MSHFNFFIFSEQTLVKQLIKSTQDKNLISIDFLDGNLATCCQSQEWFFFEFFCFKLLNFSTAPNGHLQVDFSEMLNLRLELDDLITNSDVNKHSTSPGGIAPTVLIFFFVTTIHSVSRILEVKELDEKAFCFVQMNDHLDFS